ncbi:MAG: ankyrin repeat domain-containing protein [Saprospiraceae bacterium]|nr:ankyrin repeat domain-containing protein [Saprospiraceae bacterium]
MDSNEVMKFISGGRTDYIFNFLECEDWKERLFDGPVLLLQWLVYYNDTTAIRAILHAGGDLESIDINSELGNAAFFGHWKVCDLLINHGADPNAVIDKTGETPLHNALAKAGRPYFHYVVRLLLEKGAKPNVATIPGIETGAFMRDIRTCGETPLHRAAAYAGPETIKLMLDHGADKTIKDANGDTPLTWASRHLRPGKVLQLLAYGPHWISDKHVEVNISDHGAGWGNTMDWKLVGDYLPEE